jgi:hypothetical protein
LSGISCASSLIQAGTATPDASLEGERKTVTMLFADIKGSMELIEDLDPEEARAIVDPALKLMMEAVQHYGGYVAQQTGDGIFALFGAPVALEDHPQRALLAALRIQQELRRYSDRARIEGRLPIQARVGVNTGEVVVRSIATGEGRTEYAPVGHSTGIAARSRLWHRSVRSRRPSRFANSVKVISFSSRSDRPRSRESVNRSMFTKSLGWDRCVPACNAPQSAVTQSSSGASARWRRSSTPPNWRSRGMVRLSQ